MFEPGPNGHKVIHTSGGVACVNNGTYRGRTFVRYVELTGKMATTTVIVHAMLGTWPVHVDGLDSSFRYGGGRLPRGPTTGGDPGGRAHRKPPPSGVRPAGQPLPG